MYTEPTLGRRLLSRVPAVVMVIATLTPGLAVLAYCWMEGWLSHSWDRSWRSDIGSTMNVYVRIAGTFVAVLGLISVGLRAAGSVTGERERETWDSLLTTTVDTSELIRGKWFGSIYSGRAWGWWLIGIWSLGLLTDGLSALAVFCLIAVCLVYAGLMASIGMWFTLVCRTTLRATMATLATAVFLGGADWFLFGSCCCLGGMVGPAGGEATAHIAQFCAVGLTAPVTLGILAFRSEELAHTTNEVFGEVAFDVAVGLFCYGVAAAVIYQLAYHRFVLKYRSSHRPLAAQPTASPLPGGSGSARMP